MSSNDSPGDGARPKTRSVRNGTVRVFEPRVKAPPKPGGRRAAKPGSPAPPTTSNDAPEIETLDAQPQSTPESPPAPVVDDAPVPAVEALPELPAAPLPLPSAPTKRRVGPKHSDDKDDEDEVAAKRARPENPRQALVSMASLQTTSDAPPISPSSIWPKLPSKSSDGPTKVLSAVSSSTADVSLAPSTGLPFKSDMAASPSFANEALVALQSQISAPTSTTPTVQVSSATVQVQRAHALVKVLTYNDSMPDHEFFNCIMNIRPLLDYQGACGAYAFEIVQSALQYGDFSPMKNGRKNGRLVYFADHENTVWMSVGSLEALATYRRDLANDDLPPPEVPAQYDPVKNHWVFDLLLATKAEKKTTPLNPLLASAQAIPRSPSPSNTGGRGGSPDVFVATSDETDLEIDGGLASAGMHEGQDDLMGTQASEGQRTISKASFRALSYDEGALSPNAGADPMPALPSPPPPANPVSSHPAGSPLPAPEPPTDEAFSKMITGDLVGKTTPAHLRAIWHYLGGPPVPLFDAHDRPIANLYDQVVWWHYRRNMTAAKGAQLPDDDPHFASGKIDSKLINAASFRGHSTAHTLKSLFEELEVSDLDVVGRWVSNPNDPAFAKYRNAVQSKFFQQRKEAVRPPAPETTQTQQLMAQLAAAQLASNLQNPSVPSTSFAPFMQQPQFTHPFASYSPNTAPVASTSTAPPPPAMPPLANQGEFEAWIRQIASSSFAPPRGGGAS